MILLDAFFVLVAVVLAALWIMTYRRSQHQIEELKRQHVDLIQAERRAHKHEQFDLIQQRDRLADQLQMHLEEGHPPGDYLVRLHDSLRPATLCAADWEIVDHPGGPAFHFLDEEETTVAWIPVSRVSSVESLTRPEAEDAPVTEEVTS